MPGHYFWSYINFRTYHQICKSLSRKITAENLSLVVKLHPRYSLMEKSLYKQLFTEENRLIRFEDSPDFEKTLQRTDVLVFAGITTGILEAVAAGVPVIIMLINYQSFQISQNHYYWIFKDKLIVPNSLEDFENELSKLKISPEYQKEVVRKQTEFLPFLLKSWGNKASEAVADIGLDCMNRDIVS
jgi:ATP-dependent helicase/DNAse subunit B